jgi:hypothetical protein
MMMQQTLTQLRSLKLDGFADGLEEQLTQPAAASLSFEERLSLLVDREASWMIGAVPDCSSWLDSSIRRPQLRTSTHAPVAAWTRAHSQASLSVTGSKRATAC